MTYTREQIKKSDMLAVLPAVIVSQHKVAGHTVAGLIPNKHIKDFCEITKTFMIIPDMLYVSYETSTWILEKENNYTFPIRVESITIYENFVEYELTRVRELSQAKPEDRDATTLNLN